MDAVEGDGIGEPVPPPVPSLETADIQKLDKLRLMAQLLYQTNYQEIYELERQQLEAMQLMGSARALQETAPPSSYRQQHRGKKRQVERDLLAERQAHEAAATALRQSNQQAHTFSICARSISKLLRRVPEKDWDEALARRE